MTLTKQEAKFLRALQRLHADRVPFSWRAVAAVMREPSVFAAWQSHARLQARGLVKRGAVLARVSSPVLTSSGRRAING